MKLPRYSRAMNFAVETNFVFSQKKKGIKETCSMTSEKPTWACWRCVLMHEQTLRVNNILNFFVGKQLKLLDIKITILYWKKVMLKKE